MIKKTLLQEYSHRVCFERNHINFVNFKNPTQNLQIRVRGLMPSKQTNLLSFILGNPSQAVEKQTEADRTEGSILNYELIMKSAMFWDSKQRLEKIKTLFLTGIGLKQFSDTEDFSVDSLTSIQLLSISKNSIIHLHPLSQLTSLVSLNISHNKVYDISSLSTLEHLSELYASNNSIKNIEPLEKLKELKVIQVYRNKIQNQEDTFKVLVLLSKLSELDIEENPVCEPDFEELLEKCLKLKKINGKLNKSTKKIKEMSSSKGFNSSKAFNGTASSVFFSREDSQQIIDAQSTFYNFSKNRKSAKSGGNTKQNIERKQNILQKLQDSYTELDEDFEKEIIKNVKLKNTLMSLIEEQKSHQEMKEELQNEQQEIKNLKRKAKAMKENLFTKDKKGELLRKLFEIETTYIKPEDKKQQSGPDGTNLDPNKGLNRTIVWGRKFEADQTIVIKKRRKYPKKVAEQIELDQTLSKFESTLADLKSELEYLS